jgi:osmoprotectant transport system permease protein
MIWSLVFLMSLTLSAKPLIVGSKKFTESVVLGEVLTLSLIGEGKSAEHRREIGGTTILWNALKSGDIDLYPEYTGTIEEELLQRRTKDLDELRLLLKAEGIGLSAPLGFNNTYALGIKNKQAQEKNIRKITDLKSWPGLRLGLSGEFLERKDGWPGLREAYQLPQKKILGIDHDVAYRALSERAIDVVDLYSTDAEIAYYDLLVLEDDRNYFPSYQAVVLYRLSLEETLTPMLGRLAGKISNDRMVELNKKAKIDKIPSNKVAAEFLEKVFLKSVQVEDPTPLDRLLKTTAEHLRLVFISMVFAIFTAVPLGVIASRRRHLGNGILVMVSGVQTVPALALLVLLIKPLSSLGLSGIGDTPAMIALFLYSLMPIVRNTLSGLNQIPENLLETAEVLNLSAATKLRKIELPLALPSILAGIKIALVLNVGFATLGALVGAGGYGQPILTGIRLDDYSLILEGALPATMMALLFQWGFDLLEKRIVSPGLRLKSGSGN